MCVDSPPSTCMERTSTCLGRGGMSPTSPGSRLAIDTQVHPNILYNLWYFHHFHVCISVCIPYFFNQMPRPPFFFFLLGFVRVLFEGGVFYFRKPIDINDSWIRLDGVISMCSPSVLLPAMEKSHTTQTAL